MTPAVSATSIRRATARDAPLVAELVGTSFAPLAASIWLVPDQDARVPILTASFRIFVEHALDHGFIDLVDGDRAAAVWFRITEPVPEPDDYENRLAAACAPWTDRFQVLDSLFEANHPAEPHHHLALLAVHPGHQGGGLGSALLRHHHATLDASATPAYLEASSPLSRDLYLRHGYECREPFTLPDGSPFWPMWRPPRS